MTTIANNLGTGLRLAAGCAAILMLGACSMGNILGTGAGDNPQPQTTATAAPAAVTQGSPLPAIATECPPVKVRAGGEALFSYGGGRTGNPADLHYQAIIDESTRNCVVSNGLITVTMGVAGRVLLGPKGSERSVNVPLRVAVESNGSAVFSQKYVLPVAIPAPAQSAEFVKVVENVGIPYVGGEEITIWVGFDPRG